MNAPEQMKPSLRAPSHLMSSRDYRDSLRRLHPVVFVDGRRVESVADEPAFAPGVQALGVSYDYALDPALA
ncbi:MAG: 4-hydroxyphenylacetate 3-hydroxylase, partial [Acidobacteria bacterium]